MLEPSTLSVYLAYGSASVLALFAAFIGVNVFARQKAPSLMEKTMGKTSEAIAAFDPAVLRFFLAGFKMFSLLLLVYTLGLVLLTRAMAAGNPLGAQVFFACQGLFTPLATLTGMRVARKAPWPAFLISGALALGAYLT